MNELNMMREHCNELNVECAYSLNESTRLKAKIKELEEALAKR